MTIDREYDVAVSSLRLVIAILKYCTLFPSPFLRAPFVARKPTAMKAERGYRGLVVIIL